MKTEHILLASSCLLAAACSSTSQNKSAPEGEMIGMANPASVYCVEQGGQLEIITDAEGNEIGLCHLPSGELIEEWELYRRDHPADQ